MVTMLSRLGILSTMEGPKSHAAHGTCSVRIGVPNCERVTINNVGHMSEY